MFSVAAEHCMQLSKEVPKEVLSAGRLAWMAGKDDFISSGAVCKAVCAVPQKLLKM